ncbi:MAG TPA: HU family DNA-binding protein [Armatimonadota bacterium]|nr:HU family DNA-binding protein [Armatimonadota bacterium]HOM80923.1 HU family DNA-binding protein [Armatimonadota bacterium]HOQ27261.1 HU family DNA-binding protein [Armatimonadota bacterium]HPO73929.1 HU family DNA-binding protein [Armatimonadota bacterium]HPT98372.1 HU family DNA-binding protein [Armatimonadota bacterium]
MNKSELVAAVAERAELKRKDAAAAIDAVVDVISEKLGQGEEVSIIGFGTFSVKSRAERVGRNPRTGESITIAAAKTPVFKPGKALKEAV